MTTVTCVLGLAIVAGWSAPVEVSSEAKDE